MVCTTTWIKKRITAVNGERGLSSRGFAALTLGAFAVVAGCALAGGWAGLIGIAVTAALLIIVAATLL
jgi:hypothetical protein